MLIKMIRPRLGSVVEKKLSTFQNTGVDILCGCREKWGSRYQVPLGPVFIWSTQHGQMFSARLSSIQISF